MAERTTLQEIQGTVSPIPSELLDKHYLRKHGKDAYYGQVKKEERK